jgi:enoyl-CoA hydratase/carnithine racemase
MVGREWHHFRYEERDEIATVTFSRPERLNALTFEVYVDLRDLTADLRTRRDVRLLVVRGEGRGFCSGGDVHEIIGKLVAMDARSIYDFAHMTVGVVRNLREMPQPVLASVNGVAAGAGAVIALASDFRIAAESATFQFLFTKVGLSGGDMGAAWLLPRVVGLGRATELLMLGEPIGAREAADMGLVHRVVPDSDLDQAVADLATELLERAPWGLGVTKEMLNRGAAMDLSSGLEMEAWTQSLLMAAADFKEFHTSFLERRKPDFRGR